jgi:hypothetical protein
LGTTDRWRFRAPAKTLVVFHDGQEARVRRLACIRPFDLSRRLRFEFNPEKAGRQGVGFAWDGDAAVRTGALGFAELTAALPGLWWLRPLVWLPGGRRAAGSLARWVTVGRFPAGS